MTNESLKLKYFLRVNRILQIFCEQKSTFYLEYILSYVFFSAIFLIFKHQKFGLMENIHYRKPLKIPTFCLSTNTCTCITCIHASRSRRAKTKQSIIWVNVDQKYLIFVCKFVLSFYCVVNICGDIHIRCHYKVLNMLQKPCFLASFTKSCHILP